MKKLFLAICLAAGMLTIYSCGPAVVTERMNAPVYTRPGSPGPGYIWIDGDWVYTRGHYRWREGYWSVGRSKHWNAGGWHQRRNGWYWRRGHWR